MKTEEVLVRPRIHARVPLLLAVLACAERPASDPDLIGWWRFDQGTGLDALDASGRELTGRLVNASWTVGKTGKALRFDGTQHGNVKAETGCPTGEWVHLAGTVQDSVYTMFVNGEPVRSGMFQSPIRYQDRNLLFIGGNSNPRGKEAIDLVHGMIDDVRLYRRALAAAEIRALA